MHIFLKVQLTSQRSLPGAVHAEVLSWDETARAALSGVSTCRGGTCRGRPGQAKPGACARMLHLAARTPSEPVPVPSSPARLSGQKGVASPRVGWGRQEATGRGWGQVPFQSPASALQPPGPERTSWKCLREKTPNPAELFSASVVSGPRGNTARGGVHARRVPTVGRGRHEEYSSILSHQHRVRTQVGCNRR